MSDADPARRLAHRDLTPEVAVRCAAIVELPSGADGGGGRHGR
jgi:hypothetical protein